VKDEYVKLTTYFGERQRHANRFLADALLDLYGRTVVSTSIVLRGITSFGPHHQLRDDQQLSMSEDPPIAVAAVDTAERIVPLAEQVVAMTARGLITLERARLSGSSAGASDTKLTIYLGRHQRIDGQPAYRAVCAVLHRHGFASASVLLGVDGTVRGQRRRARFFSRNVDVPVMIIGIATGTQVTAALPDLEPMLREPLLTVEKVQICKRDGELLARPTALPSVDANGRPLWQKLMVHTSEDALHDGAPIHRTIIRRLRESNAASGGTVLRGVWGFHGGDEPHGDKAFQFARRVPVTTIVVDTPERIAASFELIDQLTENHGVVTSEIVPALIAVDGDDKIGSTELARFDR
jgi:PII-like signaling protein